MSWACATRAILAILVYTNSRAGAVAKLKRGDFYNPLA